MSSSQDRIPIWSGRAVTTDEHERRAGSGRDREADSVVAPEGNQIGSDEPTVRREPEDFIELDTDTVTSSGAVPQVDYDFDSRQPVALEESESAPLPETRPRRRRWRRRFTAVFIVLAGGSALFLVTAWWDSIGDLDSSGGQAVKADQDEEAPTEAEIQADETGSPSAAAGSEADEPSGPTFSDPTDDESDLDGDRAAVVPDGPPEPGVAEGQVIGLSLSVLRDHRQAATDEGQSAWAIYTDGRIYLLGGLPDEAIGERLTERLQVLLGAGNVNDLLTIDPSIPAPDDPPLFIKETVVFNPGATSLPLGSDWILVAADLLMKRFPTTTLTVVANTGGIDEFNRDLALRRAETIVDYLIDRGIEEDRLDYESRPEVEADPDDGDKPIEFIVHGLLDNPPSP